jgi:hypothetical protein
MKTGKIEIDETQELRDENMRLKLEVAALKQAVRDLQGVVNGFNKDFIER